MFDRKEYQRKWKQARKDRFFKDKFCAECNSKDSLELDHIDPAQKIDHRIWSWTAKRQEIEIAKCQVLCFECHNNKTAKENSRPITHGNSGYDRKCRCTICKSAHSARMKTRVR